MRSLFVKISKTGVASKYLMLFFFFSWSSNYVFQFFSCKRVDINDLVKHPSSLSSGINARTFMDFMNIKVFLGYWFRHSKERLCISLCEEGMKRGSKEGMGWDMWSFGCFLPTVETKRSSADMKSLLNYFQLRSECGITALCCDPFTLLRNVI